MTNAPELLQRFRGISSTGRGPSRGTVLYDVASAIMYLGGPGRATAFLDAYLTHGPLGPDEMQLLDAFRRFGWAVQGVTSPGDWLPTT